MSEAPININTADEETLTSLPGIASGLAKQVIFYRENVHPFEETIELAAVRGISERMVREIQDQITVGDVPLNGNGPIAAVVEEMEETTEAVAEDVAEVAEASDDVEEMVAEEEAVAEIVEETADEAEEAIEEVADESDGITLEVVDTEEAEEVVEEVAEPVAAAAAVGATTLSAMPAKPSPVFESEPEAVQSSSTPPPPPSAPVAAATGDESDNGGFNWFSAIVGGILGVLLAVAIMLLLNGGLRYADEARVDSLQSQVRQQQSTIDALQQNLTTMGDSTSSLAAESNTRFSQIDENFTALGNGIEVIGSDVATLSGSQEETTAAVSALENSNVELSERVDFVAESAETFDTFLTSLRDLLSNIKPDETANDADAVDPEADPEAEGDMVPVADEEATDEEATDEEATDEEATDEEATDEEATDEEATDEEATDEEATDEEATDEEATDEEATDEEATDEEVDTDSSSVVVPTRTPRPTPTPLIIPTPEP